MSDSTNISNQIQISDDETTEDDEADITSSQAKSNTNLGQSNGSFEEASNTNRNGCSNENGSLKTKIINKSSKNDLNKNSHSLKMQSPLNTPTDFNLSRSSVSSHFYAI